MVGGEQLSKPPSARRAAHQATELGRAWRDRSQERASSCPVSRAPPRATRSEAGGRGVAVRGAPAASPYAGRSCGHPRSAVASLLARRTPLAICRLIVAVYVD